MSMCKPNCGTEFRNYGANIVIVGKDGAALPAGALQQVEAALGDKSVWRFPSLMLLRERPTGNRW